MEKGRGCWVKKVVQWGLIVCDVKVGGCGLMGSSEQLRMFTGGHGEKENGGI